MRISATNSVQLMFIGCSFVVCGFLIVVFLHTGHPAATATVLYLMGGALAVESRLRLKTGIRNGLYPFREICELRDKFDSLPWRAASSLIWVLFILFYRPTGHMPNGLAWTWLIITCANSIGLLPTILQTAYNNPDGSVRYRKTSWTEGLLSATAVIAWGLSWPWFTFDTPFCSGSLLRSSVSSGFLDEKTLGPSPTTIRLRIHTLSINAS